MVARGRIKKAKKKRRNSAFSLLFCIGFELTSAITNVVRLVFVKEQVANRCYQAVNAKRDVRQEKVSKRSGFEAVGFERGVIDDQAADPTKKEGQQKANKVVVFHKMSPFEILCSLKRAQLNYTPYIDNCQ